MTTTHSAAGGAQIDQTRADFEVWAESAAIRTDLGAWEAWQAALARAVQQAGDLREQLDLSEEHLRQAVENIAKLRAQLASAEHGFKNFHSQLCERFDYVHDEQDWRRDQVSLIERIAAQLASAQKDAELAQECIKSVSIGHTNLNHLTEEATCAECSANLDHGDDHTADCLTVRARNYIAQITNPTGK